MSSGLALPGLALPKCVNVQKSKPSSAAPETPADVDEYGLTAEENLNLFDEGLTAEEESNVVLSSAITENGEANLAAELSVAIAAPGKAERENAEAMKGDNKNDEMYYAAFAAEDASDRVKAVEARMREAEERKTIGNVDYEFSKPATMEEQLFSSFSNPATTGPEAKSAVQLAREDANAMKGEKRLPALAAANSLPAVLKLQEQEAEKETAEERFDREREEKEGLEREVAAKKAADAKAEKEAKELARKVEIERQQSLAEEAEKAEVARKESHKARGYASDEESDDESDESDGEGDKTTVGPPVAAPIEVALTNVAPTSVTPTAIANLTLNDVFESMVAHGKDRLASDFNVTVYHHTGLDAVEVLQSIAIDEASFKMAVYKHADGGMNVVLSTNAPETDESAVNNTVAASDDVVEESDGQAAAAATLLSPENSSPAKALSPISMRRKYGGGEDDDSRASFKRQRLEDPSSMPAPLKPKKKAAATGPKRGKKIPIKTDDDVAAASTVAKLPSKNRKRKAGEEATIEELKKKIAALQPANSDGEGGARKIAKPYATKGRGKAAAKADPLPDTSSDVAGASEAGSAIPGVSDEEIKTTQTGVRQRKSAKGARAAASAAPNTGDGEASAALNAAGSKKRARGNDDDGEDEKAPTPKKRGAKKAKLGA